LALEEPPARGQVPPHRSRDREPAACTAGLSHLKCALPCSPVMHSLPIWTAGHSNHTFETFVEMLRLQRIDTVVDVRTYPYSRFAPQFGREQLETSLPPMDIGYLFMGEELGGRPKKEEHYDRHGHALYELMAEEPSFEQAIASLLARAADERLAIVCSEADPEHCHRRLLVGKVLTEHGVQLRHILADGAVVSECRVPLPRYVQETLFGEGERRWRSTQSVLHRRVPNTSLTD
jgi:hypothetical protein